MNKIAAALTVAFTATVFASGEPSALYVQTGLIAHWDGIDNAGPGEHDASASAWVNIAPNAQGGNLPLAPLTAHSWADDHLVLKSGNAQSANKLISPRPLNLGGAFTIEVMAYATDGSIRRWESHPFTTYFESWTYTTGSETGYLERIQQGSVQTRIKSSNNVYTNELLAFTTTYDGSTHRQYVRREDGSVNFKSGNVSGFTWNKQMAFLSAMAANGRGYSIRIYNRVLTDAERAYNSAIDQMRFQGRTASNVVLPSGMTIDANYTLLDSETPVVVGRAVWTGAAGTGVWSDAGNWSDGSGRALTSAPIAGVVEIGGDAAVTIDANATVAHLVIAEGASVNVAQGVEVTAAKVTYGGDDFGFGIYSGTAANGAAGDWVTGAGVVRVAGNRGNGVPTQYREPVDGWYEFGLASGHSMGEAKGYASATDSVTRPFVKAERIVWDEWGIPAGAKVRLVGGVLMESIPSGRFSEVDTSGLKRITLFERTAFDDGTALVIPSGCEMRYSPGTWQYHAASNGWYQTAVTQASFLGDVALNGGTLRVDGNGTHYSHQVFDGKVSGTGKINLTNFSNHFTANDEFDFTGSINYGSDNGGSVRIYSPKIRGEISKITMSNIGATWFSNEQYCACLTAFGPKPGAPTTDGVLYVKELDGYGNEHKRLKDNKRMRTGGVFIVWGGNTVRIGKSQKGVHVVGSGKDQHCDNGSIHNITTFGMGNVCIDEVSGGNVYGSTNVNLRIGKMKSGESKIDYTFQSGAINGATLDVTNTCAAGVKVMATDLAMLPARISGFTGNVELTETAAKTYPVTIDLSQGPEGVYNFGGCDGSGTLATAPAAGVIDVSFAETEAPINGEYALARFTSVGDKLDGWQVTFGGVAQNVAVVGRGSAARTVQLMRDDTGLWLKVKKSGFQVIIR